MIVNNRRLRYRGAGQMPILHHKSLEPQQQQSSEPVACWLELWVCGLESDIKSA
eukprot:CAMPEP_0202903918 /NCGR_PEP_ID=MMETSP1392-20130828/27147_1 /ASSEMBLY_ACC=CAM_ASM_000868 /TAXON_ID=225041 /ORGANISM="Chlamydomonas chlamydogama, Strain SAG 11-48b" /LENGTH=53 /DNA_ID=CAMNT_0049591299 /DNA_START=148 /DNA_END=309 /DNA_ORIENTATION=-